jgi:hypothetical protein
MPCTISSFREMQMLPGKTRCPSRYPRKGAPHSGVLHQIRGCLIDLLGRNSRPDQLAHPIKNLACRAAGNPHLVDLPSRLYRNHRTRSSIKAEISAKHSVPIPIPIDAVEGVILFVK